jgi:hypothetical protein
MSQDIDAPDFLSLHFPTVKRGARRWRHMRQCYTEDWVLKLLRQIDSDRADGHGTHVAWLMRHRPGIRAVVGNSHPASIHSYLAKCQPEMIPMCVWLLGRCAEPRRHYGLSAFRYDSSPQIRKHVAKALRRAEAWTLLDDMARAFPEDAKVQWFANAATTRRSFAERLDKFTRNVDDSHAYEVFTPSRMPFWALERSWDYSAPKSVALIRRMLWRIRHWVRWGVS